jgi:hypothetical protein
METTMRTAIAIFVMLHGVAHVPGFIVPWRIATLKDMPYKTTLLSGRLDAGPIGIRIVGSLWLAAAIAFVLVGVAMIVGMQGWFVAAVVVTLVSLILSLLSLPEARVGVVVNVVILALLAMSGVVGFR